MEVSEGDRPPDDGDPQTKSSDTVSDDTQISSVATITTTVGKRKPPKAQISHKSNMYLKKVNFGKSVELMSKEKTQNLKANELKDSKNVEIMEELIAAAPSERNWRGILIALLVIVAVLGMILFSIVIVTPVDDGPRVKGRRPTLQETLNLQRMADKPFNGSWISDNEIVYRDPNGGVSVFNAENMTTRVIMTNSTFRQLNALEYQVSSDLKYVLLLADIRYLYKYTKLARYYIYEVATRSKLPLSPKEDDPQAPFLQYAKWTPDGKGIVFIHNYDIYYKPKVRKSYICRITNSASQYNQIGSAPVIQNGIPDWLYEHEILDQGSAVWFSPDSQYLAYLQINNTMVGTYQYPWYGGYHNNDFNDLRYPEILELKYPKVGTPNPNVTIWICNLSRPKFIYPQQIILPEDLPFLSRGGIEKAKVYPDYIISVKWFNVHNLGIVWLNRAQNQSGLVICKSPSFNCSMGNMQETPTWIQFKSEPNWEGPIYNSDGDSIQLMPVKESEFGEFLHICFVDVRSNQIFPLTQGKFEVTNIIGWDQVNHIIYAIATPELKPGERHLYRVGDINSTQPWQCLTCSDALGYSEPLFPNSSFTEDGSNVTAKEKLICLYNRIHFSPNFQFYIQECLGPNTPYVVLFETVTNSMLQVLDPGSDLREMLAQFAVPQIRNFEVEIEDGYYAQIKMLLPPGLREEEDIMFPMILLVDASPGSQSVSTKWSAGYPWYLAANKSYIVLQVDGRGSGYQGFRMRHEIHHRLGSVEVQDQLSVLTYLRNSLKFVSPARICIAGTTSYGSYAALTLLATDLDKVVNCTVALSPITNWRLHNTFFTERYLGSSPTDYFHADLATSQRAQSLVSRRLFLAHGIADTEVHSQHSMALASILVRNEALFTYLTYPDTTHGFKGVENHLYKQIDQFFEDTFDFDYDFERWDQAPESDPATDFLLSFRQ